MWSNPLIVIAPRFSLTRRNSTCEGANYGFNSNQICETRIRAASPYVEVMASLLRKDWGPTEYLSRSLETVAVLDK